VKIYLRKVGNVYHVDLGDDSHIKNGEVISCEIKRPRNYKFLQKFFTLINYAYSVWEPEEVEYKGKVAEKSIDRFREDVTIMAGYYKTVVNVKNEVKLIAESISFANMEEDEFERLYSKTINVLLKLVFANYTKADIDKVVEDIIGFD
jgi:hypothetical protein